MKMKNWQANGIGILAIMGILALAIGTSPAKRVPSLFKIKCADTNGNITIDTEVNAYSFIADDLTFKFNRADGKYFVVSGFCRVEEQ